MGLTGLKSGCWQAAVTAEALAGVGQLLSAKGRLGI